MLFSQNLKKFHQLSINYILFKNVKCKVTFTEAYLEPSQTSTMKVFDEEKCCLMDVSLDSKYNSGLLDTTCKMAPLNSFILQYSSHNQFIFWFQKLKHYIERHLMTNFRRFHSFINIICIAPLPGIFPGFFLQPVNGSKN